MLLDRFHGDAAPSGGEDLDAVLPVRPGPRAFSWRTAVFLVGFASLLLPILSDNFFQSWTSEQGEQAPIVLAIGCWMLWRRWPAMMSVAAPGSALLTAISFAVCATLFVFGQLADQYAIKTYAFYGLSLSVLYGLFGRHALARGSFPLAFLVFALPVPYGFNLALTSHLRLWVTQAVVSSLRACGLSIVRDGLNIFVDQYAIAVREACSGMNSLFSLSAIGLAYVYLRRSPPWWYFAIMAAPIVAFALVGNFARVLALVLMTHFAGDAVAQGALHETTGVITFVVALFGVFAVDALGAILFLRRRQGDAP